MSHFYLHDVLFNKLVLAMNVTEITINHSYPVFVIQVLLLCAIFFNVNSAFAKNKIWALEVASVYN